MQAAVLWLDPPPFHSLHINRPPENIHSK
jgi:hypothetical protein